MEKEKSLLKMWWEIQVGKIKSTFKEKKWLKWVAIGLSCLIVLLAVIIPVSYSSNARIEQKIVTNLYRLESRGYFDIEREPSNEFKYYENVINDTLEEFGRPLLKKKIKDVYYTGDEDNFIFIFENKADAKKAEKAVITEFHVSWYDDFYITREGNVVLAGERKIIYLILDY